MRLFSLILLLSIIDSFFIYMSILYKDNNLNLYYIIFIILYQSNLLKI